MQDSSEDVSQARSAHTDSQRIHEDDEIVITWLEHHANIVPWQMLCAEKGAHLRVVPVDDTGQIQPDEYEKLLGPKARLVSIAQVSNALEQGRNLGVV